MNKLYKSEGSKKRKMWRVRVLALTYFTVLMTVFSPQISVMAPSLKPTPAEASEPDFKDYASRIASLSYGWGDRQVSCLNKLWGKESAWNPEADNPTSTAFGIAQMLGETSKDGYEQIRNGLRYINHRYENPCHAWEFWLENNWY